MNQDEENPRAEYGWKPGAVVNVGIKSGTNSIHGTAFAFVVKRLWMRTTCSTSRVAENASGIGAICGRLRRAA